MARKRQIDPDIWTSEQFINLSIEGRLLFIGMISMADDEGRLKGNPLILKANLYPADNHSIDKIRKWRDEVINQLLTSIYVVDGQEYLWLPSFKKYQYMTKRFPSKLPEFSYETGQVNDELLTDTQHSYEVGIGIEVGNEVEVGIGKKTASLSLSDRMKNFEGKVLDYGTKDPLKYPLILLFTGGSPDTDQDNTSFFGWWTETDGNSKMKFEKCNTFEVGRRLGTWMKMAKERREFPTPVLPLPEKECEEI